MPEPPARRLTLAGLYLTAFAALENTLLGNLQAHYAAGKDPDRAPSWPKPTGRMSSPSTPTPTSPPSAGSPPAAP